MNLKNILRGGLLMSLGLLGTSCEKNLNLNPLSQVSTSVYWKTANDAVMFATQAYNYLPTQDFVYYEAFSDNGYTKGGLRVFGNGTYTALSTGREWDYAAIRHCLIFMRDVELIPNMDATLKARLIGEVKFVLAYRYFIMTSLYRDVPLVEKVFENAAAADLPKTPKADIVKRIIQWLDEAATALPETYPAAADKGRITKGAAIALQSRVLLHNNNFDAAAQAAKKVMAMKYSLYPDYFGFFQDEGDYSAEDILSFGYLVGQRQSSFRSLLGSMLIQMGNNIINPTAELVADYETDKGYYPYTKDPRYDPTKPFDNRDPRMRQTLYYPGAIETVKPAYPDKPQFDPFNDVGDRIGADQGTNTGFAWTKYVDRTSYVPSAEGSNNWKILRFGEVLLNFAEATNEVSGPTAEVIAAIDRIRVRAKMPTVANTFTLRGIPINQETMREFIRHERRIELACEGLRYFDILRWKIGEKVLNTPIYTVDASAGISAISTAGGKRNTYPKTIIETRLFIPRNYVWPIPQAMIDRSKGVLVQHDEWK